MMWLLTRRLNKLHMWYHVGLSVRLRAKHMTNAITHQSKPELRATEHDRSLVHQVENPLHCSCRSNHDSRSHEPFILPTNVVPTLSLVLSDRSLNTTPSLLIPVLVTSPLCFPVTVFALKGMFCSRHHYAIMFRNTWLGIRSVCDDVWHAT